MVVVMTMMMRGTAQMHVRSNGMSMRLGNGCPGVRMRDREQALAHQQEGHQHCGDGSVHDITEHVEEVRVQQVSVGRTAVSVNSILSIMTSEGAAAVHSQALLLSA